MRYGFDLTSAQGESPYFAVFEVEWDDAETMAASLSSPEGQAVAADMASYVTQGTVIVNYLVQAPFAPDLASGRVRYRQLPQSRPSGCT
jgi:hypothetical protein